MAPNGGLAHEREPSAASSAAQKDGSSNTLMVGLTDDHANVLHAEMWFGDTPGLAGGDMVTGKMHLEVVSLGVTADAGTGGDKLFVAGTDTTHTGVQFREPARTTVLDTAAGQRETAAGRARAAPTGVSASRAWPGSRAVALG